MSKKKNQKQNPKNQKGNKEDFKDYLKLRLDWGQINPATKVEEDKRKKRPKYKDWKNNLEES